MCAAYERGPPGGTVQRPRVTQTTVPRPGTSHIVSSIATIPIAMDSRQARASSGRSPQFGPAVPPGTAGPGTRRTPDTSTYATK